MAYQIDKYNGTFFVSVDDQTINSTATDLKFVGKNYAGYGEIQNENFLWLLENFANSSAPSRAVGGQVWYDTTSRKLKFFDKPTATSAGVWKVISGAEASAIAPTGLAPGDLWFNTVEQQIFTWSGTEFVLVGPEKTPIYGETSSSPMVVKDSLLNDQTVIKIQVSGQILAIIATTSFTLHQTINPITGFLAIQPGINFINSDSTTGVTSTEHRFWGTAANSQRLGGLGVEEFMRSSNAVFRSSVSFKDNGFTVGDQNDLKVRVANGDEVIIENTLDKQLIFRISNNNANIKDVAIVSGTGVNPGTGSVYNLGSSVTKWKEVHADEITATTFYGRLVGTIETPGDGVAPLTLSNVAMSGNFIMDTYPGDTNINFSAVFNSGGGTITLKSGTVGTLNNFNIGNTVRGTGAFTTLTANGITTFTSNTASTVPTNGAVVVTGGVGVSGALNVAGNSNFSGTGALGIPVGTTEQRIPDPVQGAMRYNTTIDEWEGWDGSQWRVIGLAADEDYGLVTNSSDSFVDYGGLF